MTTTSPYPPVRIPITVAQRIAKEFACSQVIVLAFHPGSGQTHVVTYGRSQIDCEQAAAGGNRMKEVMGWPPDQCQAKPAR
jgi:hypothetical protein